MVVKFSILTVLSFLIFSFNEKKETNNTPAYKTTFEKDLFESDEILSFTLKGNIRGLLNDRGETPTYHPVTLSYKNKDSSEVSIPVKMKTRGHFRKLKSNCKYPPLLINFHKDVDRLSVVFKGKKKLKLVMPCAGDDHIIREWLVYKIYNLVTPNSFSAS